MSAVSKAAPALERSEPSLVTMAPDGIDYAIVPMPLQLVTELHQRSGIVRKHTQMPPRQQLTPYGEVTLSSRFTQSRYYLVAMGPLAGLKWMFPGMESAEAHGASCRHTFSPGPKPVTVERELRRVCALWQQRWTERLENEGALPAVQPVDVGPRLQTLGELFDHLYLQRRDRLARSTVDRDRYRLQVWRDALGNGRLLADLTPSAIAAALEEIGRRTSPTTANTALGLLKTYLTWAGNTGLLRDFSFRTVKRLKEKAQERHRREWWTTEEVELAVRVAAQDNHQPTATLLVACGCYLGLRPEEVIMLRWEDLSLDAVDPVTNEPKPVCHVTPHDGWQPKDGEARDIPICSALLGLLKPCRKPRGYLLNPEPHRPGRRRGAKGWVYRYNPTATWRRIMRAVTKAGGRPITMYGMRHSFASNLLIGNVSDVKVARWLGHADTRMLHRHYGHLLSWDGQINALSRATGGL